MHKHIEKEIARKRRVKKFMKGTLKNPGAFQRTFSSDSVVQVIT